jgi:hypothetical protein
VRKARRAGALYGGREPSPESLKPLRFRDFLIVRLGDGKSERGHPKRDTLDGAVEAGEPERSEGPREQRPRPDLNRWGSRRGHGFFGGSKPLELDA